MNSNHILYIDGLKGIALLFILFGHFSGIWKYAQSEAFASEALFAAFDGFPLSIIVNETFWLCVFCVLSGYALSLGRVESFIRLSREV